MTDINILDKGLVVITTCNRYKLFRLNLSKIVGFLKNKNRYDLVVAIDGMESSENHFSLQYAQSIGVACVVGDKQEGVGISKNRVVSLLPDYDFYFFIEDDVEVMGPRVFDEHLNVARVSNIHHFSLHHPSRLWQQILSSDFHGLGVIHTLFGSAQLNFFTGHALRTVGGWHKDFATLRRGGHTEHSYRVYRNGLAPAPFNFIEDLAKHCVWHDPEHVVWNKGVPQEDNGIYTIEAELIDKKLPKQPFYFSDNPVLLS